MMQVILTLLITLALVICALMFMRHKLRHVDDKKDLKAEIDLEIEKLTKGDPKEAIMVGVYKKGNCYFKCGGRFNADLYQKPDKHSVFQIASLSKLFTASILHSLIDQGVVTMDSTLQELLGDQHELAESAQSVTLRQLVTHTAGFPRVPQQLFDLTVSHFGKDNVMQNPYSILSFDVVMDYLKDCEGKKEPGEFIYSNFGLGLLGHVLEVVTEKSLDELAKTTLFAPLNMMATSIELGSEMTEAMVQGYSRDGSKAEIWKFGALAGAGAFNSTTSDMLVFLKSFLEQGIHENIPLNEEASWLSAGKLEKLYGNEGIAWHNGLVGGFASYASVDRENDSAVIILSAKAADLTMPGIMLTRAVRTQSWANAS